MSKSFIEAKNFYDSFTQEELEQCHKIVPLIEPGDRISVYWKDEDYEFATPGRGYALAVPNTDDQDIGNLVIHFPWIPGEKGDGDEIYVHLVTLCNNESLDRIEVERFKRPRS